MVSAPAKRITLHLIKNEGNRSNSFREKGRQFEKHGFDKSKFKVLQYL